jgi:hypothetical protein
MEDKKVLDILKSLRDIQSRLKRIEDKLEPVLKLEDRVAALETAAA